MRRRRETPLQILVTWASLLVAVSIVTAGWLMGKPLTTELSGMLAVLIGWAVRADTTWRRRLADHKGAIRAIAARQDVSLPRAESIYDLTERQLQAELVRPPQALPPGRRRQ